MTLARLNNAPVQGFEQLAGSRTDLRLVNHVMVDMWAGVSKPKDEGRGAHRFRQFDMSMCINQTCLLTDTKAEVVRRLARVKRAQPNLTMTPLAFSVGPHAKRCLAAGEASLHLFRTVHRSSPNCVLFVFLFSQPHVFL